jgi:pilus assembly protein Flp/PilA
MEKIVKFFRDEDGLELSEYAIMGALIIIGLTGLIVALATGIGGVFTDVTTEINARPVVAGG